jgi:hypothetical protein
MVNILDLLKTSINTIYDNIDTLVDLIITEIKFCWFCITVPTVDRYPMGLVRYIIIEATKRSLLRDEIRKKYFSDVNAEIDNSIENFIKWYKSQRNK